MEYVLLVLLGLAIPVAGVAAFFLVLGTRSRLFRMEQRFAALEQHLFGGGAPAAAPYGYQPPPPVGDPGAREAFAQYWDARHWAAQQGEQAPAAQPTQQPPAPVEPSSSPAQPAGAQPAPETFAQPDAGMAAPPPPSEPPPAPPQPPAPSGPGLEEQLGTRWVVWVGGVALALGAIFLVRYSIEQGLIGPGVRILLGTLFSAGLIAAGEWTRRQENLSGVAGIEQASIPAILTAAGTTGAYATVWAAYALYDFIGPGAAFVLLGVVALATLTAALLHGPALAGLGLVGAYIAPLLVSTQQPNFWALYIYLAIVTGAAFALARVRLWRWLAITAVVASVLWVLPGIGDAFTRPEPHALYLVAVFALAAALIVVGFLFGPDADGETIDGISSATLAAYVGAAAVIVVASDHATIALTVFTLLVVGALWVAWHAPSATGVVPVAALFAALVIVEWAVQIKLDTLVAPGGPVARDVTTPSAAFTGMHLTLGAAFAALFGAAGFFAQGRSERALVPLVWAFGALLAPIAILVALYYRIAHLEQSIPFAALALLLAALYATATELLVKRTPRPGTASAAAFFAVGAVASLALALTFALEKGWLTVALALMAPGIAMIADKRPLPALRWFAAACAALVSARILWEPRIVADVGTTPIFNWLLWGYGVPAVSFWVGGALLRRRGDDVPSRMLDAAAILFTVLTVTLQIRHYVTGGDIYQPVSRLMELGLQVSALTAIAIGLERVRGRTQSPVHNVGAIIVAALALATAGFGLLFRWNPLFSGERIEGLFFNLLMLAYGLPAVLAITLALIAKSTRPMGYRAAAASAAVVMALTYLSLQVRRFYHDADISLFRHTSDPEFWTYSVVWLAFGVVLLLVGILVRSQPARLASAIVIFLTVLKVFLADLAGIGGIWRSLSFIGLGGVLIGIGWLYQRLLFPRPGPPTDEAPPAASAPPDAPVQQPA